MILREFVERRSFKAGSYAVSALTTDGRLPLLDFEVPSDDEPGSRHVPAVMWAAGLGEHHQRLVQAALVRAGARHPGLRDDDLARLHRVAGDFRHVEVFTDLNALTTGLLGHVVRSLGPGVGRVVIASCSVDVLHEYQSMVRRVDDAQAFLRRAEMARALRVLDGLRQHVPVHVHQLAPGTARYFHRNSAQPPGAAETEGGTFISEDRQMIGAFWDYVTTNNPRLPVHLVTSDFALAHVCAAERVPFLFAPSPFDAWRSSKAAGPDLLWFDPFALALRAIPPHALLWELSLVYGGVNVEPALPAADNPSFGLSYVHGDHLPGHPERLAIGPVIAARVATSGKRPAGGRPRARSASPADGPAPPGGASRTDRRLKLTVSAIAPVLPTRPTQAVPLTNFRLADDDSLRQLRYVGDITGLYKVTADTVEAGESLEALLAALKKADYVGVNAIFRRHVPYDRVLREADAGAPFPSSKEAGSATSWAIVLGAAYKSADRVRYGLDPVSDEAFEQAVVRAHAAGRSASVPLPDVIDHVCTQLRISPIRFEAMLGQALGKGALAQFETQRATVSAKIPAHPVLVFPTSAASTSYLRDFEPGKGAVVGGRLMGTLVRRPGGP